MRFLRTLAALWIATSALPGCDHPREEVPAASAAPSASAPPSAEASAAPPVEPLRPPPEPSCPSEMVLVAKRYCVDRYEARLSDLRTGKPLSPYYVPSPRSATGAARFWSSARLEQGSDKAKSMPLPELYPWQASGEVEPMAVSEAHVVPQGYASGVTAARACKNAGKRLCSLEEWRTACRGERERDFPYGDGDRYVAGKCNVFRDSHPAAILHGDPSQGHSDPRLNLVRAHDGPLLRRTGTTSECVSVWGDDGIADMVGNLDEWVDDPDGTFVGGFYARSTKAGCQARIETHSFDYQDYSTGLRCCADLDASDL